MATRTGRGILQRDGDTLVTNSVMMIATTASGALIGYFFWLVAARSVSPATVGLAAAIVASTGLVAVIAVLGVGPALIERLSQQSCDSDWWCSVKAGTLTSTVVAAAGSLVMLAVMPLVSKQFDPLVSGVRWVGIFLFVSVATGVASTFDYAFIADRFAAGMLVRNTVSSLVKFAAIAVAVIAASVSSMSMVGAWGFGSIVGAGAFFLLAKRHHYHRSPLQAVFHETRALLPRVASHQLIGLGGLLPTYVLPILVTVRLSATDNAYFYTAWMLGSVFFMISPAVAASLFAEGAHSPSALRRQVGHATVTIAALLVPCMALFVVAGGWVLSLFGSGYQHHATELLVLLAVSALPDAVTNVYVSVCRVQRRLTNAAILNGAMAVSALTMSWFLLPRIGIAGVGWAWLSAQTAGAAYVIICLVHYRHEVDGSLNAPFEPAL